MNKLFTHRYRPQKLEDCALPERVRKVFINGLNDNFLLHSVPGTGKTTIAKILALNHSSLYINISDDSSVDTIRTKITEFCDSSSLGSKAGLKCVILDEIDGASDQFFKALRGTIEKYEKNTRFVATCNYLSKIPPGPLSRFTLVILNPQTKEEEIEIKQQLLVILKRILDENSIVIEDSALDRFIEINAPDIRQMVSKIGSWFNQGITKVTLDNLLKLNWTFRELYEMILKDEPNQKMYAHIRANYSTKIEEVLDALASDFPDWLHEKNPQLNAVCLAPIIKEIWSHQVSLKNVIDPLITLWSCIFSIQTILKKAQGK